MKTYSRPSRGSTHSAVRTTPRRRSGRPGVVRASRRHRAASRSAPAGRCRRDPLPSTRGRTGRGGSGAARGERDRARCSGSRSSGSAQGSESSGSRIAHRRVAGHQEQVLAAQEPAAAHPPRPPRLGLRPAAAGRSRRPGQALLEDLGQPLRAPPDRRARSSADRRSPAAAAPSTGSTRRLRSRASAHAGSTPSRSASAVMNAGRPLGAVAVVARLVGDQVGILPDRHAVAAARSSPTPSAAATRPDTTSPGRSAAAPRARTGRAAAAGACRPARRFGGPSAAVFHSSPSVSSIETNVGSPPIVSRTSPAAEVARRSRGPSRSIACHCVVGVGLRDPRDPRGSAATAMWMRELGLGTSSWSPRRVLGPGERAGDRGRGLRVGGAGQRDVPLAGEQPRRRIEARPSRRRADRPRPRRAGR